MHAVTVMFSLMRFLLPAVLLTAFLVGCASHTPSAVKYGPDEVFRRIAVVPFQKAAPEDINVQQARHPIAAGSFRIDQSDKDPEKILGNLFLDKLKQYPKLEVIPTDKVGAIFLRTTAGSLKATLPEVLKKIGEEVEADGIVVGYLYRWRELQGRPYAAEKPASVAFDIQLFRVKDGALIWRGFFDRTQTSLMENMLQMSFFFKEGGRWVSVRDLANAGLDEVLKTFPAAK
jgi:hypothetical protein